MLKFKKNEQIGKAKIKIIGVGGAGNNAINTMIQNQLPEVEFIAVNTDLQVLNLSESNNIIQIGKKLVKGLGAGGIPEIGKQSAEENETELLQSFCNSDILFITAGMGGGTGTGASPIIAKIAKENNIMSVAVVTYPFESEGTVKRKFADDGINELKNYVNTLIVVPNERVKEKYGDMGLFEAFKKADNILCNAAKAISNIINKNGYINVDLADVKTVMSEMGYALIGIGESEGENKAEQATKEAISNPLLSNLSLKNSKAILINITAGYDIKLSEFTEIISKIKKEANNETNIIEGLILQKNMKNKLYVTIIATGIPESDDYKQSFKHIIKEKSREQEIFEIQKIIERIHKSDKISPSDNLANFPPNTDIQ
ncbi:MAG: cell division protein FtsZ [Candidatus Cloacimonetes bacterium]|nr:cell division protein FtsZ [Candidatus Cloacimonadota bacterium]